MTQRRIPPHQNVFRIERVHNKTRRFRGWDYSEKRGALVRVYEHPSADAAAAWMEFVRCCAASAEGVAVEFEFRGPDLTVVVRTEGAGGVTRADFELVEWLEQRR